MPSYAMPPPPHVDILYEAEMLKLQPSIAMVLEKGEKILDKKAPQQNTNQNEFAFNGYTQLILFCIIESKKRKLLEYETKKI